MRPPLPPQVSSGFVRGRSFNLIDGSRALARETHIEERLDDIQNQLQAELQRPATLRTVEISETAKTETFFNRVQEMHEKVEVKLSPSELARKAKETESRRRAEARIKGYEGDSCGQCGNFTLVRNGTCMKCDTCGGTSGCS